MNIRFTLAALGLSLLGACATQPTPCTPEWIDYRTTRILSKFASENRGLVNDLRQLTRADGRIDPMRAVILAARSEDIERFALSFQRVVVPELNAAIAQCARHEEFVPAFTEFLRREGVPESSLEWVGPILALIQAANAEGGLQSGVRP